MVKPVVFDNRAIEVGASFGVSVYPHDGNTAFELVRAADVAMYHATAAREGGVHFFSADMKSTSEAGMPRKRRGSEPAPRNPICGKSSQC